MRSGVLGCRRSARAAQAQWDNASYPDMEGCREPVHVVAMPNTSRTSAASVPRTREELRKELQELHLLSSTTPAAGPVDPAAKDISGRHAAANNSSSEGKQVQPRQQSLPSLPDAVHGWGSPSSTPEAAAAAAGAGCCSKAAASLKGQLRVLRHHPYIWVVGLLVASILIAAGTVGVLAATSTENSHRRQSAQGFVDNAAVAFEGQVAQTFAPLLALVIFIHDNPYYPALAGRFDRLANELLSQLPTPGSVDSLQLTPQGVVMSMYPLEGNEAALGHDLFHDPKRRDVALKTVARGNITMQGPMLLKQGYVGAIPRLAVFIPGNWTVSQFGLNETAHNCAICQTATPGSTFWGFVSAIINFDSLVNGSDSRLKELVNLGYNYEMKAQQPTGGTLMIAKHGSSPTDPVIATVHIPNGDWTLYVQPQAGWVPGWRDPMLAAVVVVGLLLGLLLTGILAGQHMQRLLLRETQAANSELAAEKERMDVLLARQYNLISCVLDNGVGLLGKQSMEEQTLERIEDMRRCIGVVSTTGVDELQLGELLGEGSFGKVYKGIWRGSVVAIKTMILPAKMSGAAKRERMAIMEAAISSSMNHPNIVQTYTYTIRPTQLQSVQQQVQQQGSGKTHEGLAVVGSTHQSDDPSSAFDQDHKHVHSYEVSLVLEYCDWGCLRDALDAGAFFAQDNSLNYAAILETAADVAKAMLHLHRHQVLHSDLKVRNVLLKSDGASGRGVVAKVADFGLAVRMDHQDTHVSGFQGTMSHMAPEALLHGRISKAGDVYSFGITLWELFTSGHAYAGVPKALLGHQVTVLGVRPVFPPFTPQEYVALAQQCWAPRPEDRPCFDAILQRLQQLRGALPQSRTAALNPYVIKVQVMPERAARQPPQQQGVQPHSNGVTQGKPGGARPPPQYTLSSRASFYVDDVSSQSQHGHHGQDVPAAAGPKRHSPHQRPERLPRLVPHTAQAWEVAGPLQQHHQEQTWLDQPAPEGAAQAAARGTSAPGVGSQPAAAADINGGLLGLDGTAAAAGLDGWHWAGSNSSSQKWLGSFGGLLVQTSFMSRMETIPDAAEDATTADSAQQPCEPRHQQQQQQQQQPSGPQPNNFSTVGCSGARLAPGSREAGPQVAEGAPCADVETGLVRQV